MGPPSSSLLPGPPPPPASLRQAGPSLCSIHPRAQWEAGLDVTGLHVTGLRMAGLSSCRQLSVATPSGASSLQTPHLGSGSCPRDTGGAGPSGGARALSYPASHCPKLPTRFVFQAHLTKTFWNTPPPAFPSKNRGFQKSWEPCLLSMGATPGDRLSLGLGRSPWGRPRRPAQRGRGPRA